MEVALTSIKLARRFKVFLHVRKYLRSGAYTLYESDLQPVITTVFTAPMPPFERATVANDDPSTETELVLVDLGPLTRFLA